MLCGSSYIANILKMGHVSCSNIAMNFWLYSQDQGYIAGKSWLYSRSHGLAILPEILGYIAKSHIT